MICYQTNLSMSNIPTDQISQWLKKLERESWQLELLVSAFSIFLLIQANFAIDDFLTWFKYQFNVNSAMLAMLFVFIGLLSLSIKALIVCLIAHLMLRGFWIGTIGLRSVQSTIDFSRLNYSSFFTKKLKDGVISLDQLVVKLDEICSVVFSFSFLIISMLMSLGLFLSLISINAIFWSGLGEATGSSFNTIILIGSSIASITLLLFGLIYMIDYFTLGFMKKFQWFSRIYYPIYAFFGIVTLSVLSRSIYYYMISKFSKKKIRWVFIIFGTILSFFVLIDFDQKHYYPQIDNDQLMANNYYDNQRPEDDYIEKASISSHLIKGSYLQLFIRYNPKDNQAISHQCEGFTPLKEDGFNWALTAKVKDGGIHVIGREYEKEDFAKLLTCLSSIYQIQINDSVYHNPTFYFYTHPDKNQKGLIATISSENFLVGENVLRLKKIGTDTKVNSFENFAFIPFWYEGEQ
jgi:hypothetical protein